MKKPLNNSELIVRNEKGQLLKGSVLNPNGKPKGTLSITNKVKRVLEDNPELLEEIVKDYIFNPKFRELLWRMVDGLPKREEAGLNVENLENLTIVLDRDKDDAPI